MTGKGGKKKKKKIRAGPGHAGPALSHRGDGRATTAWRSETSASRHARAGMAADARQKFDNHRLVFDTLPCHITCVRVVADPRTGRFFWKTPFPDN